MMLDDPCFPDLMLLIIDVDKSEGTMTGENLFPTIDI